MSVRFQSSIDFIMRNSMLPSQLVDPERDISRFQHPVTAHLVGPIIAIAIGVFSVAETVVRVVTLPVNFIHIIRINPKAAFRRLGQDLCEVARCALRVIASVAGFFIAIAVPRALFQRVSDSLSTLQTRFDMVRHQGMQAGFLEQVGRVDQLTGQVGQLQGENAQLRAQLAADTNLRERYNLLRDRVALIQQAYIDRGIQFPGCSASFAEAYQGINRDSPQGRALKEYNLNFCWFYNRQLNAYHLLEHVRSSPIETIRQKTVDVTRGIEVLKQRMIDTLRANGFAAPEVVAPPAAEAATG